MSWTDERIETLKTMWEAAATASQIAEALGGVSRNAVIGKAHRLGLQARPSPVRPNEPVAPEPVAAAPEPAPVVEEPDPEPEAPAPRPVFTSPFEQRREPDPQPVLRSVGPGGFVRQAPGEQQAPSQPAPPRRLVPAKPSPEIAGKTGLLDLNDRICKWPLGHPGEADFHFCGVKVNPGFPYCVEHCGHAYQAQMPRRDRRPPPPLPFGGRGFGKRPMLPKDATLRSIRKLLASEDAFVSKAYWALRRCQQTRDQPLVLRIGITGTGQYPNYRIDNAKDGQAVAAIDGGSHEPWPEGESFQDSSNWSDVAMLVQDVEDLLSEIRPSARRLR